MLQPFSTTPEASGASGNKALLDNMHKQEALAKKVIAEGAKLAKQVGNKRYPVHMATTDKAPAATRKVSQCAGGQEVDRGGGRHARAHTRRRRSCHHDHDSLTLPTCIFLPRCRSSRRSTS